MTAAARWGAVLGCAALLWCPPVVAATCQPITSVPITLSAPGVYCLAGSFTFAPAVGAAIDIVADDVTLDLGHYALTGTAGPASQAVGIQATTRRGLTVRGGTLRGFFYGVLFTDLYSAKWAAGGPHLIRNVTFEDNWFRGIRAEGRAVTIEGCHVSRTGGTTVYGPGNYAFGIEVFGAGAQILRNLVDDTVAGTGGESVGISLSDGAYGSVIEGNVVANRALSPLYRSFGVWIGGASRTLLVGNRFLRLDLGAAYGVDSFGQYRDNSAAGVAEIVRECIDSPCSSHLDKPGVTDGGRNN